jgi:multicomponent K+:H+ antiporter subunit G
MTAISMVADVIAAALLIAGALLTLIGSAGLLRLDTFYARMHAPTLGTTLGILCVAAASLIHFSAQAGRPVVHEVLIVILITVSTPISLITLVRAALFRDQAEGNLPGTHENRQ